MNFINTITESNDFKLYHIQGELDGYSENTYDIFAWLKEEPDDNVVAELFSLDYGTSPDSEEVIDFLKGYNFWTVSSWKEES